MYSELEKNCSDLFNFDRHAVKLTLFCSSVSVCSQSERLPRNSILNKPKSAVKTRNTKMLLLIVNIKKLVFYLSVKKTFK